MKYPEVAWFVFTQHASYPTLTDRNTRSGYLRSAEALAKAELARKIGAIIERRELTQSAAAALLEVDQPKVSALTRGRRAGFSLDRLVRFLVLLGSDVEIVVKPRARAAGRARVMVA